MKDSRRNRSAVKPRLETPPKSRYAAKKTEKLQKMTKVLLHG
jgi:hypothetical protein